MKRTFKTLFPFVVLAGSLVYAQRHQPPDPAEMIQHHVDALTRELGLSSAQQQQASTIFTNAVSNQKALHDQMRTAHQSLETAVTANNSGAIDQAANTIGGLMTQSIAAHAKADAAFYQLLTPDQQTKFTQMKGQHEGFFGGLGGGAMVGHPHF